MTYDCEICGKPIEPNADGKIRVEGITHQAPPRPWAWGPVPVHEECRLLVKTPYDDQLGEAFQATSDFIQT